MRHPLPPLDSLKVFEAAARHLSFSLAADELCLTKGAVSHQIRKLERHVQCPLFRRSVRQVFLTEAGQRLLKTTQQVFSDLGGCVEGLRSREADRPVVVAVTTYVAVRWLSAAIARFNAEHPQVSVVFRHTVNARDFKLQEVDFAVRWCRCLERAPRQRLSQVELPMYPVCSPKLLENVDAQGWSKTEMLSSHCQRIPLLCEDRELDLWAAWYGRGAEALQNPRTTISDANVRVQAAVDGHGWMLADRLMHNELQNGLLVAPFDHQLQQHGYALLSAGEALQPKAQLLRDCLAEALQRDLALHAPPS